jgi:hypothetical protein
METREELRQKQHKRSKKNNVSREVDKYHFRKAGRKYYFQTKKKTPGFFITIPKQICQPLHKSRYSYEFRYETQSRVLPKMSRAPRHHFIVVTLLWMK